MTWVEAVHSLQHLAEEEVGAPARARAAARRAVEDRGWDAVTRGASGGAQ